MQTASTVTKYNVTQPEWREKFHLCVFESNQVLKLVIAHNMEYSASRSPADVDLTLSPPANSFVRCGRIVCDCCVQTSRM